ncbi:Transposase [Mycoavidus cysteinexigens]|uniref:Transposase n=1 Tax=Mycoavidus cysteinexigens TaxID=1553431 RepID=A0A2Z6EXD5_9BURK|nr:Transposase [Mycoavidus cysteinexigens]GLR02285.1 hypothetical protein GCM10007934_21010 [Mycoavidus cysteinexigens]
MRSVWLRRDLESFKKRLSTLEKHVAATSGVLTEAQVVALEKKQGDDVVHGEIETSHPGYLGSQDAFYVGTIKGIDRIYQQTFVDIYSKRVAAKLSTTKSKVRHPKTNGICERFHKTILQEFYQVTFRRKIYSSIEQLQNDLEDWLAYYNNDRTHQGKMCCSRTPIQTLIDGKEAWRDKISILNN